MFRLDDSDLYRAEILEKIPWLEHAFGTRLRSPEIAPNSVATLKQIHSDRVLAATEAGRQGEGDALVTNRPGIALAIRTADCLPILMADPRNRAIAAVHAGWRGVASEIVPNTIETLQSQFGTHPEDLVVAIGPGIGGCCFEVGPEVAVHFRKFFPEWNGPPQRMRVDLVETTLRQLRRHGGTPGQIATSGLCSCCGDAKLFHSYRRDKAAAGRMVAQIAIRGEDSVD